MQLARSVADLIAENVLSEESSASLATPANLRLGREIAASGGVELIESGPLRVVAKVTGGQRRTVALDAVEKRLRFTCTCTSRADLFCKHLVAAAIVTVARAPARSRAADRPKPYLA
ncbi:hypothetical protein SAMN05519104_4719 [Rhizobiales bacterium GAS188]|nr:hypothetical protein SAMN05519104_4719 [Rhizobiales bacterium GAS188]